MVYYPFRLCEEALREVKNDPKVGKKEYALLMHQFEEAKNNVIRWHHHVIRSNCQQEAWIDAKKGCGYFLCVENRV